MATSLDTPTAPRYVDFDEYIDYQLQRTGQSVKWTDLLTAAGTVATLFLGYLLVFVVFDHWIVPGGFGYLPRVLMLVLLLAGTAVWLVWRIVLPWFRRISRLYAARVIEKSQPEFKSGLVNLIDLRRAGRPVAPEVLTSLEKRAALTMSHMDVEQVVDRRPLLRVVYALLGVILLACLYSAFTPKRVTDSVRRALFPTADVEAPTETEIVRVEPGDVEVLRGTQLEVLTHLRGKIPENVTLLFSTDDREFVDAPLVMRDIDESRRSYRVILTGSSGRGIQQDLSYRIVAGDDTSRDFRVTVLQPPSATVDELRYEYPPYMQMEPKTQPGGEITGWEGTRVTISATSNVPLASAKVIFSDDKLGPSIDEVPMERLDGRKLRATWPLAFDRSGGYPAFYRIECRDSRGQTDPEPTVYTVKILPDRVPEVRLVDPKGDLERPANATVPLLIDARDDFRLRQVRLRMRRNGEEAPAAVEIFRGDRPSLVVQHEWQLEPHAFQPGDVISYWIEADDSREPHANTGRSAERELRIVQNVPPQQAAEQLEADRRRQQEQIDEVRRDAPPDMNDAGGEQPEQPQADQPPPDGQQQPVDQPQPGEQGREGEQAGNDQPMPGDAAQDQQNKGQSSRDGGTGEQTAPQVGQDRQGTGQSGSQQPLDPHNPDDAARAFKEYLRELQQQQDRQNQPGEPGNQPPDGSQPGSSQPSKAPQPGTGREQQQPNGADRQPQPNGTGPDQSSPPSRTGGSGTERRPVETGARDSAQQPGAPELRDDRGSGPMERTPADTADQRQPDGSPGTARESAQSQDRRRQGEGSDPQNPAGAPSRPEPAPARDPDRQPGGAERGTSEGGADNNAQPGRSDPQKGRQDDSPPDGAAGNQQPKPMENGRQEPTDGTGPAQRREATGDEKGVGTPERDPNAKPTPAGNDVQRKDGTDPVTRKPSGDPGATDQQPNDTRPGARNPGDAQPAPMTRPGARQQPQPEQQPGPADGPKSDQPPARTDRQQKGPDEQPLGPGRPDGQRSHQPDTGEAGAGTEATQGTSGSNQQGPGDETDERGGNQKADRPTGQPGTEKGSGSTTRESQKDQPGTGQPREDQSPTDAAPDSDRAASDRAPSDREPRDGARRGDQPGTGRGPSAGQRPPSRDTARDSRGEGARQPAGGGVPGGGQPADGGEPLGPGEAPNLEHGRKAANMVLRRLQDEINRGEISDEWLKKTGWTEDQARRFADQLERQLNDTGPPDTPEELARRRQFDEFLRSLAPRGPGEVRKGSAVQNRTDRTVFDAPRQYVPPEYRDLAEWYKREISKRESKR